MTSMLERCARAVLDAMDLMDGLDGIAAETYARAVLTTLRDEPTTAGMLVAIKFMPNGAGDPVGSCNEFMDALRAYLTAALEE